MFIAFEGVDCCGKSTIINKLKSIVSSNVVFTREPGGNDENEDLRKCLFKNIDKIDPLSAQVIMMGMRLNKKYPEDKVTISDRCVASLAYYNSFFTLLGISVQLHTKFPDYLFYFDINPEEAVRRMKARNVKDGYDTTQLAVINKRISNYSSILSFLTKTKIIVIDANRSVEEVLESVKYYLNIISEHTNETILQK